MILLRPARAWIHVAEHFRHPTTLLTHETSLRLLNQHPAAPLPPPQHLDILKTLTSSLAVNTFSARLHNCAPARVVELLE